MKKKLIIVVGPTASGKSDLTFKLAQDLKSEIIVCDAYQVYKEISKGINKPEIENLNAIKHHFVNHVSINEVWHIKRFKEEIEELINSNMDKNFILEGGSNLYIDCLINNYQLNELDLTLDYSNLSNDELYEKLQKLDFEESLKISKNNKKRLIQALRIIESNNNTKKSVLDKNNKEPLYDFFLIRMIIDRDILYKKINDRADKMFKNNWREEVEQLIKANGNSMMNTNALKALGYDEIYNSIIENRETNLDLIKQKTRNYAKRQETWIRNKFKIDFNFSNYDQYNELLDKCKAFLNDKK
ncbi:tRNA (adenosine(37)-N6)-dimethylallyltransferase MiaA [Malacoplasma penetrans]|uniref:tRNA dimethylallyltransferase n=1 Tax=Malacoplasma penetrans (strain HF-2) TaxID=272633 RepID=MIAA_MALP2|nr:tRNA (adenosine(37)-N6)-dimethylallyltransferase MiaA [Malacoplasma penetrans]Q8CXQ5.1 RecName: Full=tRNA dimethylallyltransferase; AltName: Full=Dimethylallyl diphosphate:tRNA dimethylallyltransferase; Short=DMAPP:tRNA dimethylallyltransferase; Short=DMATase; AltName: Full=Isopentenyl-diphosphate:tRNA isopentenyltransferase; Short=IPP transferase; Short=IPPT; Short=IPTase [Malacoplasma penetrans HF-2]RXY96311.1 tRNA (adenosine(37)-N6)-dimethylallyltransferase MiaA [Malacoplasma penetrans]BAC